MNKYEKKCLKHHMLSVIDARYVGNFVFFVTFSNKKTKHVDIRKLFEKDRRYDFSPIFQPLKNELVVRIFEVNKTLTWCNGKIDIAPNHLYAIGVKQTGKRFDNARRFSDDLSNYEASFRLNEMVSYTDFAEHIAIHLDKITSGNIEKFAIFKDDKIAAVAMPLLAYEAMIEAERMILVNYGRIQTDKLSKWKQYIYDKFTTNT